MTYLERAIADGYAFVTGSEGKEWITYVTSDNHKENIAIQKKKCVLSFGQN